jgi:uncharacterized protein (TIGR02145 family)
MGNGQWPEGRNGSEGLPFQSPVRQQDASSTPARSILRGASRNMVGTSLHVVRQQSSLRSMPARIRIVAIALGIAFGLGASSPVQRSANAPKVSATIASKRMPDGKLWTTSNLNVHADPSFCYDNAELNCLRYGRLYTWESARRGCQSLGGAWRLPTSAEWQQLAKHFGGVRDDSTDGGKAAYTALLIGGTAGFNALLAGGRGQDDGQYSRLDAHGFYWTASETDTATAWFYNFGKGGSALNRHSDGEKQRAFSVRCVRE